MTVTTQEALERALKSKETHIRITGTLAETIKSKIQKQRKRKKLGKLIAAGGIIATSVALTPITGGTSLIAGATALTATGLSITAAELAILAGFTLAMTGLLKGYNVKFNSDRSINLEKK